MNFNWLDAGLLIIILITFILGIVKGFIKQIIGLAAVVVGLVLAVRYYDDFANRFLSFFNNRMVAYLLGFLAIFFVLIAVGGLVSYLLSKMARGPLKAADRALGAGLGLLKGILIGGVIVFSLLIFPADRTALRESRLAPYCLRVIKAFYLLIPQDFKDRFTEAYRDILGEGGDYEERF